MKRLDLPPLWLILFAVLAFAIGRWDPWKLSLGPVVPGLFGGLFLGGGVILIALALSELRRWRTTPDPHGAARHLVTSGIYKRSRNPIYAGLALILAGIVLVLDAPLALPLIPIFVWWIERHFVIPEENRLRRQFRADFARYTTRTRRWI